MSPPRAFTWLAAVVAVLAALGAVVHFVLRGSDGVPARRGPNTSPTSATAIGAMDSTPDPRQSAERSVEPEARAAGSGEAAARAPDRRDLPGDLPSGRSRAGSWDDEESVAARRAMVEADLAGRDITDRRVLDAMGRVPRHQFVPLELRPNAYDDRPLPIGFGQTISQPYIVALMTQLAQPRAESRALDVGTGSGYQAAVLAELCKEVYGIEIVESLAKDAAERLRRLGYSNVTVRAGDGYRGWPEKAPFDLIIVAAAPDHVPPALVEQLAPGGRLVLPVGRSYQQLIVVEKLPDGTTRQRRAGAVAFVPMTGEAERP